VTWKPPATLGRLSDDERALLDFARQLGLGHLLIPHRCATRQPTGELLLELFWRAHHAVRSLFRRRVKKVSSPDVVALRRVIAEARAERLSRVA
jgi:hypothetical protein